MKTCGRCKVEKPLDDFAKNRARKDGRQSWCRACNTVTRTKWAQANKEKTRAHTRYSRYRLREEDFQALIDKQDGACAVCKNPFTSTPHVDHDHSCCPYNRNGATCGKCIRGLLCSRCNVFIGYIELGDRYEQVTEYLGK